MSYFVLRYSSGLLNAFLYVGRGQNKNNFLTFFGITLRPIPFTDKFYDQVDLLSVHTAKPLREEIIDEEYLGEDRH